MYQNYGSLTGFRGDPPIPGVGFDWDDGGGAMPVNASNVGGFATAIKQFVTDRKVAFQGPILAVWGSDYRCAIFVVPSFSCCRTSSSHVKPLCFVVGS